MIYIPSNLLMLMILLMSTIMAISSSNWFMAWASLEVNLLAFIPLMMSTKTMQETEASVKYLLSQAMGSSMMIVFSLLLWSSITHMLAQMMLLFSLLIKLGAAPCHFWFPSVMSAITWENCLLLTTWQKLGPLMLLLYPNMSISSSKLINVIAPLNAIIGGLLGLNQSRLRSIIAYSSITHIGWMLSAMILFMPTISISYFIMYTLIIMPLLILMIKKNMTNAKNMNHLTMSTYTALTMALLLLSLGGLPPLTGFIPKLMIINMLSLYSPMLFILILGSLMNLFFYLNLAFNLLLSMKLYSTSQQEPLKLTLLPLPATGLLGLVMIIYALIVLNKP